jgi:hypothetical protein
VLPQLLRHVDLRQRLGSCSLVCKSWRAGAAAATSMVSVLIKYDIEAGRSRRADSLAQWLNAHGAAVTHIDVVSELFGSVPLQLPWATLTQLQHMHLSGCVLEEQPKCSSGSSKAEPALWQQQHPASQQVSSCANSSSSSSHSSASSQPSLACLTSLTVLALSDIMCGLSDGVAGLSALTGLQQLQLGQLRVPPPALDLMQQQVATPEQQHQLMSQHYTQYAQQLWQGAVKGLYQLSRLTQLELVWRQPPGAAPGLFRHMQQLQELRLLRAPIECHEVLQDLPASLTKLEVKLTANCRLGSSAVPALTRLTALQHLVIEQMHLTAWVLTQVSSAVCSSYAR